MTFDLLRFVPNLNNMTKIHKTAIVDKDAMLADDVQVGPYCLIGPGVKIGPGTKLGPHCVIHRDTVIGKNNNLTCACFVGADPQDLKYKGAKTYLVMGDNNIVREYVTLNRGTAEGEKTIIGSNNLFMAASHAGHNCAIGNNNVFANAVLLGGHVVVEDNAILGGMVGVHQFCRIGRLAIIGGCSKVVQDIPPFSMCDGNPASICGLNKLGLDRAGINSKIQLLLKRAFKLLFKQGLLITNAIKNVENQIDEIDEIKYLLQFIRSSQKDVARLTK